MAHHAALLIIATLFVATLAIPHQSRSIADEMGTRQNIEVMQAAHDDNKRVEVERMQNHFESKFASQGVCDSISSPQTFGPYTSTQSFSVSVPFAAKILGTLTGPGDIDLYMKAGSAATTSSFTCVSGTSTSEEFCSFSMSAGTLYVLLDAYAYVGPFSFTLIFDYGPASCVSQSSKQCMYDGCCVTSCSQCTLFPAASVPADNTCNDVTVQPKWTRLCAALDNTCHPGQPVRSYFLPVGVTDIYGSKIYSLTQTTTTNPLDLYSYDLTINIWQAVCVTASGCVNPPIYRGELAFNIIGNYLYVGGGLMGSNIVANYVQDYKRINLDSPASGWELLPTLNQPPPMRAMISCVWQGKWVLAGGVTSSGGVSYDLYIFDGSAWSKITPTNSIAAYYGNGVVLGDNIYLFGYHPAPNTNILTLNLAAATKTWRYLCIGCGGPASFTPGPGGLGTGGLFGTFLFMSAHISINLQFPIIYETWVIDLTATTPRWVRLCREGDVNCQTVNGVYPGMAGTAGNDLRLLDYKGKGIMSTNVGANQNKELYSLGCATSSWFCATTLSCVSSCSSCQGYPVSTSHHNWCQVGITKMCPGVASYVPHGSPVTIIVNTNAVIKKLDTGSYFLWEKCGGSASWSKAQTVSMSAVALSADKKQMTLTPSYVLLTGCDYKVEWGSHINVNLAGLISPTFEYVFTTRTSTGLEANPDERVSFVLTADPNNYSQQAMLNLLGAVSCGIVPNVELKTSAGSVAMEIAFSNLAVGTAQHLADYLAYVFSTPEFSVNLQAHNMGTVLTGTIVHGTATSLTAVSITNDPTQNNVPTTITIQLTSTAGFSAGGKLRLIFPEGFTLSTTPSLQIGSGSAVTGTKLDATTAEWTTTLPSGAVTLTVVGATMPPNCLGLNGWVWSVQLRPSPSFAVTEFYIGNPSGDKCVGRTVVVFGDPHFQSFSGGYFDITGTAGRVYNVITDTNFVWNSMFVTDDFSTTHHIVRHMQTFLGNTAVVLYRDTIITMDPHSKDVLWNGKVLEPNVRHRHDNNTIHFVKNEGKLTIIRAPGFRLALKSATTKITKQHSPTFTQNVHFDHAIDLIAQEVVHPHGLLGQTVHFNSPVSPVDHRGSGVIEGGLLEYELNYLSQAHYRYSRYGLTPTDLATVTAHWSHSWFNLLPLANGTLKADGFEVVKATDKSPSEFWVTHVEPVLLQNHENKRHLEGVNWLKHPLFDITLDMRGKAVTGVKVSTLEGGWALVRAEEGLHLQTSKANATTFLQREFIGAIKEGAGLWIEEHPLCANGVIITIEKYLTLYLRRRVGAAYFGLQIEVHDAIGVSTGAKGLFIDALKSPVLDCCKHYVQDT